MWRRARRPARSGKRTEGHGNMLSLVPISLKQANTFVAAHHRHHKPVTGHKFSIGCEAEGRLVGVVIAGRPVSRYLDNGLTLEVNRLCTTGEKNVCSMLYSAVDTEPGTSLRAAGWSCAGPAGGERWTGQRRPAADLYPAQRKLRYEKIL